VATPKTKAETQRKTTLKDFKGLFFMIISAIAFSGMTMLCNYLGHQGYSSAQLILTRTTVNIFLCSAYIKYHGFTVFPDRYSLGLLIVRGVVGVIAMCLGWFMFTQIIISDGICIRFTSPFLTMLIAPIFLKEPFGKIDVCILLTGFAGVMLVVRPHFLFGGEDENIKKTSSGLSRGWVIFLGFTGAIFGAFTKILVRKLKHIPAMVTILYLMVCGVIVDIGQILIFPSVSQLKIELDAMHILAFTAISLLGFIGQCFKTEGLKLEAAGPASMMGLIDLLLAPAF